MERLEGLGQDIPPHDKVETLFITVVSFQKGDVWDGYNRKTQTWSLEC